MNAHASKLTARRAVVAGALLLATTVGGLAVSDLTSAADPERPASPPPVSSPVSSPVTPVTPVADDVPLPDGRHFGWLRAAYVAPDEIVFDSAELIPGDTEDGAYTVRDIGGGNMSLPVSSTVEVTVVSCDAGCTEGTPITYATLTLSTEDGAAYWITVDDGAVVRIDQQYLA